MIVTTKDPITGYAISDPENHPFVVEGEGPAALKIYFESEATKRVYLDSEWDNPWEDEFGIDDQ